MADITFGTAPIGGGKSLWGVMHICKELQKSDRLIVTNIPLILSMVSSPERTQTLFEMLKGKAPSNKSYLYWSLQEYCQAFIERPIDITQRVVCLNEEQSREFFMYLPTGGVTTDLEMFRNEADPEKKCSGYKLNRRPHVQKKWLGDFSPLGRGGAFEGRGVYCVMDEFHKLFSSRDWQSTGPQLEDYMSEIRKINGDLLILTQHPEKVDKNCRRNATEWIQFENMSRKTLFMGVTIQKKFRYYQYEQAEMPTRLDKPTRQGTYSIDSKRRYEFLYHTMQGSSIMGGGAGITSESLGRKGFHPIVWILAIAGLLVGAYLLPRVVQTVVQGGVGSLIGSVEKGASKAVAGNLVPTVPISSAPVATVSPSANFSPVAPASGSRRDDSKWAGVYCTGIMEDGTNVVLAFSNGMIARSEDNEVQAIGKRYVRAFGVDKPFSLYHP